MQLSDPTLQLNERQIDWKWFAALFSLSLSLSLSLTHTHTLPFCIHPTTRHAKTVEHLILDIRTHTRKQTNTFKLVG